MKFDVECEMNFKTQVEKQPVVDEIAGGDNLNYENMQSFAEAANQSTDSLKSNAAIMKEFGNVMPELIKNLRYMNSVVAQTGQSLPAIKKQLTTEEQRAKRQSSLLDQGALSIVNSGSGIVQSYANGNMGGVVSGAISGVNSGVNNLSKMAENADMADMAKLLTKLGVGVAIAGAVVKGADVLANKYIDEMPTIFGTCRAFGDMSNSGAMIAYQRLNEKNVGTNLNITEFQTIAQTLRQQGVGNGLGRDAQLDLVGNIAARTGQLAYITGGDASQYANLAGLMSRYGGSTDVAGDFEKLIASGRASGLNDTQIPEFLSGIQKVMEEGIAKGFTRSATDVASTMLMFSKMSGGNAFWQGEQGAKIINQANAGLSSATSLSKTTDILAYRAINRAFGTDAAKEAQLGSDLYLEGGGYVNNMMLLEQGLNAKNFGALMGVIGESTDSKEGQIERIRQMFGLNYTGASRLLQLDPKKFEGNEKALEEELKKIQNDPEMQNNETRNQKAMNDIKAAVVSIGEGLASLKIDSITEIAGYTEKIERWLGLAYGDREKQKKADAILDNLTPTQRKYYEKNKMRFNFGMNEEEAFAALEKLSKWNGYGKVLDYDDLVNDQPVYPKAWETNQDVVGALSLNHVIGTKGGVKQGDDTMESFLKVLFKDDLLKTAGSFPGADLLVKYVMTSDATQDFRAKLFGKTEDKVLTRKEMNDIVTELQKIYELWKDPNAITVKMQQTVPD